MTDAFALSADDLAELHAAGRAAIPPLPPLKPRKGLEERPRVSLGMRYTQWNSEDQTRLADALRSVAALYAASITPEAAASAALVLLSKALWGAKRSKARARDLLRTISAAAHTRGKTK